MNATLAMWQLGQPLASWLNTMGKLKSADRNTIMSGQGILLTVLVDNAVRLGHLHAVAPDNLPKMAIVEMPDRTETAAKHDGNSEITGTKTVERNFA